MKSYSCLYTKVGANLFLALLYTVLLVQCSNQKKEPLSKELDWLSHKENYTDSTYEQVFQEQINLANSQNNWNDAATAYFAKGDALDYFLEYDSIYLQNCQRFYNIHQENIRDSFKVQLPYFVGSQYDFSGQYEKSNTWLKTAIANSKNPPFDRYAGNSYMILSSQKIINQLDSAQLYAYKALEVSENLKDTVNIGTIQYDFYRINSALGDDKAAINSLEKVIHYAKMKSDTINLALAYISFGLIENKKWTENKRVYPYTDTLNQIITKWSQPNEYFQFLNAYLQANKYIAQENIEKAKEYILLSESFTSGKDRNEDEYLGDLRIRYDYVTKKEISPKRFEKWLNQAIKQKDYYSAVAILNFLVEDNKKKENYKSALMYLDKKYMYRDSLWNDDLKGKLIEFEKKYETAQKEQKIAKQKQKLFQRNAIIGSLTGLLFLLALASVAYSNIKSRKAAQREKQLQENFSQDLLQNTEDERSRIAGDLHDSVNHNLLTLKQKSQDGQMVTGKELEDVIQQVRSISYNLYPAMFEEVGLQKSIEELCRKVAEVNGLQIVTQIDYKKTLSVKRELQIYRIVEEALNNIMKHSEATHAMVKITGTRSEIEVSVKDNGKGVLPEVLNGEKITFGMANMMQRAKTIQANINLSSTEKGTELKLVVNS